MKRNLFSIVCIYLAIVCFGCSSTTITDKNAQLIQAVHDKNMQAVKTSLINGADINASSYDGKTALYVAAQNGYTEAVKFLLDKGANVEKSYNGQTALYVAVDNGCMEVVRLLLDKGADVNTRDKSDITVLRLASSKGYAEVVKLLLEKGADVNAKASNDGATALMMASQNGYTEIVRLLLEKGADVNAKANEGVTALWAAANEGKTEVVKILLEKDADVNAKRTHDGTTALYVAWEKGHTDVVKLLVKGKIIEPPKSLSEAEVSQLSGKIVAKIAPFTLNEVRLGLGSSIAPPPGLVSYSSETSTIPRTRLEGEKKVPVYASFERDGNGKFQRVEIYVKQDDGFHTSTGYETTGWVSPSFGSKVAIFNQPLAVQSDSIGFNEVWLEDGGTITQYQRTKDGKWMAESFKMITE